ncbi:Glycoside hydrolase family 2 N-terminal [Penicillium chrysogenum]|uniref:Glycoside hydrolase family 2 N-terminal n=1 Tax=Penicillium chrysogenum TaxID=5076 RepID=A0ABQ8W402_PENCH|nr:Glycoside hydrolase family 2 N-terminal [Penicillium chrysogenum]KAJ5236507.1 Glycoside hydrolase family 2 N-terminal [Penicillium chrysogenum]KAJ5255411.1 Glycoside hydrolase family 2 N-terminal [Penicillium chrysogenum]KAJ5276450.1 Glycoside hydrolase family 2 N-terminal [Penicillium chrysogenum]
MHLTQSFALSCLVATGLALPGIGGTKLQENKARSPGYAPKEPPLTTPWTDKVGTNPWPEYPRPLLQRPEWKNLNGVWKYQNAENLDAVQQPPFGQELAQDVLIPSCLESGLSGIQSDWALYSWFSTSFEVSPSWKGEQVLLNFGAVDYEATVFINGQNAGFNRGGYFRFVVDVTQYLKFDQPNELLVFVHDPTDDGDYVIPIGKQTLRPSHIFYTPCSGIWQSVWLETAPSNHITQLDLDANMDGQVSITVHSSANETAEAEVTVHKDGETVATHKGPTNEQFQFTVSSPMLWSPDSPNLYNVTVKLGDDQVESYTGFRTISRGKVDGIERPLLNGEFIFMFGTLDQGYWPDGLYTPPSKEAMVYDLQMLKKLGFNMVRKHIKIETDLFYQACDELGLLVIQDMPSLRPLQSRRDANGNSVTILPNDQQQVEFARQLDVMVNQFKSFPSIVTWVVYNEGWGQITSYHPEFALTDRVRQLDPTRLVDSTSGWVDHGAGDFSDNHHYANPQCGSPFYSTPSSPYDPNRIGFQGEFGGIGTNVSIENLWNDQAAIDTIDQTYEIDTTIEAWNYRSHRLLNELEDQVRLYACSGGVWTQTTDVEGEVNGLMTYDRRVERVDVKQWQADIKALYDAAAARS